MSARTTTARITAAAFALLTVPATAAAATTVPVRADGWVAKAAPGYAHGFGHGLRVDRSPARIAYLRFDVPPLGGMPAHVTLRLRALSSSRAGIDVRSVGTRRWREARLTWRNAPHRGAVIGRHGRFGRGTIDVDVTRAVTRAGTVTFALTGRGRREVVLAARERGARSAPRLIISMPGGGSGPSLGPPSSAPPAGGGASGPSVTQPPGFTPLSDAQAAARVRTAPEIHPANDVANHRFPNVVDLAAFHAVSRQPYSSLVTGGFTGTTDDIIQWAAWKWGIDEDVMRAVAVQESDWRQSMVGDGGVSFGMFQVKSQLAGSDGWEGTFPLSRDDTAFNADYYGRAIRSCYDGRETWLGGGYSAGDFWDCIGWWFSGDWQDSGGRNYVASVKRWLAERTWAQPGY
jgi:autotransporter family porin